MKMNTLSGARLGALVIAAATVGACGDKASPTSPTDAPETRQVAVTDTSTRAHAIHWNIAVLLPDGGIGFVCAESNHTRELGDGTLVKVSHMLSSTPCDAYGRGK